MMHRSTRLAASLLACSLTFGCDDSAADAPRNPDPDSDTAPVADVGDADDARGLDADDTGGDSGTEDVVPVDVGDVTADADESDVPTADADVVDADAVAADADVAEMPSGERTLSGTAYFFDLSESFTIAHTPGVAGAVVSLHEFPHVSTVADDEGHFTFEGLPSGVELTLRVQHADYYPTMTRTFVLGEDDIDSVTFQVLSRALAAVAAGIVGANINDPETCSMATTVTAISDNMDVIWAVGEPGATTTTDPAIDARFGPVYFNRSTTPDPALDATTSDGGVVVSGPIAGTYEWFAHKDGYTFHPLTMRCVPGWLTNASPPHGLVVATEPSE